MPERIYTSAGDGKPEALDETPFPTEDELQALIAEHPQLLDGAQIRPGDARRWFLVTREKGIAASAGAAARWAVDHVIIDQDAVPTPAEVQCSSNPEIRRTIVGQLLEYAAYASETWTAEELRGAFKRHAEARGRLRKPSLRPCCKRMETPMWTGSGRTCPRTSRRSVCACCSWRTSLRHVSPVAKRMHAARRAAAQFHALRCGFEPALFGQHTPGKCNLVWPKASLARTPFIRPGGGFIV